MKIIIALALLGRGAQAQIMMAGLFMPNGVDPMCHGNYVGDATACECEDATKNDDGSDGALRTTLGYGAIAAAALLA